MKYSPIEHPFGLVHLLDQSRAMPWRHRFAQAWSDACVDIPALPPCMVCVHMYAAFGAATCIPNVCQHGLGRTGTASSGEATGRSIKKLQVSTSMGTGQIHSTVLKKLIDAVVRSPSFYVTNHANQWSFLTPGKTLMLHPSPRKARRRITGTTGWSASPQPLERSLRRSLWSPLPSTWETRR